MADDFKPGLEGVVAVETEIAEPDKEGGVLRYRGVDITELVGRYPYENVWGLLVDNDLSVTMPEPEPYEPVGLTGNAPSDLQAETARLSGAWKLGKLNEISDEQAREDLGRLSAQMMGIVARSARIADGKTDQVPHEVVAQGKTAAERFLLQWRGEADPKAVKAIDTYWICTAEHGLNASTFTARIVASTGADCGAALSSAVGALSGPLHGGAPAYVKPMLEEVAEMGDPEKWVKDTPRLRPAADGLRAPDLPRRGPALADPEGDRTRARLAADPDRGAARGGSPRGARAPPSRAASEDQRRVLLGCRPRHRRDPAAACACHVRVLTRGRLVRPHSRAEAHRPPLPAERALRRARAALAQRRLVLLNLAEAAAQADAYAEAGDERKIADLRRDWEDEVEGSARSEDYRLRAVAYRAIGQFRFRQKIELLQRGLDDESPACRGSALISLELLSRDSPGAVNTARSMLHRLATADDNQAVRRLAIVCLKNGSAHRDTIALLEGLADDDRQEKDLRETASKVAATLKKKGARS